MKNSASTRCISKRFYIGLVLFFVQLIVTQLQASPLNKKGKLAIIIDDIGYTFAPGRQLAEMPIPLTLAVLPFTPYGTQLAELGYHQGKEIMLHNPMSNEHNLALGPGGLTTTITREELIRIVDTNLANIPYVKGLNNHMGSQLTQDAVIMGWLMQHLKTRNLYFIDSRTTAKTQALNQAQAAGLPSRKRDVFLDNTQNIDQIKQQLELAIQYASQRGSAIAIGHPYKSTITVLKSAKELAELHDVKLVLVSDFLSENSPEVDSYLPGFCPAEKQLLQTNSIFVTEPFLKLRHP